MASHCLCQLSALIIPDISRRRTDQPGHRELLHVLAHIDPHHIVLVIKQILCECFRKLCLPDAGRAEEQEGADRAGRILDSGFGSENRVHNLCHRLILTDDTFMKFIPEL